MKQQIVWHLNYHLKNTYISLFWYWQNMVNPSKPSISFRTCGTANDLMLYMNVHPFWMGSNGIHLCTNFQPSKICRLYRLNQDRSKFFFHQFQCLSSFIIDFHRIYICWYYLFFYFLVGFPPSTFTVIASYASWA